MDKTWKPTDLFAKLSPRLASALAAHLQRYGVAAPSGEGQAALHVAWHALAPAVQQQVEPALARIHELCCRKARSYVLEHARQARRDSCPSAERVLDAISTPDLAVRLYLEDPSALERAYFQYATALIEQVAVYQGQYIADVIPSYDRRARMLKALHTLGTSAQHEQPLAVADFVSDDRFVMALHRGAQVTTTRRFDAARQLDPNLCQPEIEAGLLFRFDSSMLIVKAPTCLQREALRDSFVHIFVGDPRYFEARSEQRPRYRLTIDPALAAPVTRPSLVKAATRPRLGEALSAARA
jgi:hypothetical protein